MRTRNEKWNVLEMLDITVITLSALRHRITSHKRKIVSEVFLWKRHLRSLMCFLKVLLSSYQLTQLLSMKPKPLDSTDWPSYQLMLRYRVDRNAQSSSWFWLHSFSGKGELPTEANFALCSFNRISAAETYLRKSHFRHLWTVVSITGRKAVPNNNLNLNLTDGLNWGASAEKISFL